MEIIRLFFEIVGIITTTVTIFGGIVLFLGWFSGVFLVMKSQPYQLAQRSRYEWRRTDISSDGA